MYAISGAPCCQSSGRASSNRSAHPAKPAHATMVMMAHADRIGRHRPRRE
jgi:hypothetical protein